MTTTSDTLSLTCTHRIEAEPERVFDAWLDPATLARFMLPMADMPAPEVSNDPKVGGRFDIVMRTPDQAIPHWGEYKVIDRATKLVFSWQSPFSVEGSVVSLTFAPEGTGTFVTLTHERFPDLDSRNNHERGWARILSCLQEELA